MLLFNLRTIRRFARSIVSPRIFLRFYLCLTCCTDRWNQFYLFYRIVRLLPIVQIRCFQAAYLYLSGFRIGAAMQFQGGVIRDNAVATQARGCKKNRLTDHAVASGCLGTDVNTPRAIRLMLPTRRCWPNIAETVLSCGDRPTAVAYSARFKTGCALKREQIRIET